MRIEEFLEAPAAELELPVKHLSATSIGMFMRCPEQFRRRYVLHEKERPGAALVVGRGFHFAQETNFRQKIESGKDLPLDDVVGAFHAGWDSEVSKYGGVDEIQWDDRIKPDTLRSRGVELVKSYHTAVAPRLEPASVEREFNLEWEDVPVPINGYLDFEGAVWPTAEELAGFTGGDLSYITDTVYPAVIDYKTANRAQRALKPEWLIQARIYQAATGKRVEYHVAVKTKEPSIITPNDAPELGIDVQDTAVAVTKTLLQRVSRQIAWHYSEFGPDQTWPGALTHPWACGFCGYRPNCMWWAS